MLKNYFLIALRHLYQNPLYSAINILGLTIGIACCILILTAVRYELSFDRYFSGSDRIYRVGSTVKSVDSGEIEQTAYSICPVVRQMAIDFPEVKAYTRMFKTLLPIKKQGKYFTEAAHLVDPEFFQVFNFQFIAGNPESALQQPLSIVLTRSLSEKYFGNENPLGKSLSIESGHELKVTGVIEDIPPNTHFDVDALTPLASTETLLGKKIGNQLDYWWMLGGCGYSYIKLKEGSSADIINSQLKDFYFRHVGGEHIYKILGFSPVLQKLVDIHLNPLQGEPVEARLGHRYMVYVAVFLAGMILLTACINFINLTTARVSLRAREVGIRKVSGATEKQLVKQFLVETFSLVIIATVLACAVAEVMLPAFGNILNRDLEQLSQWNIYSISAVFMLLVVTTLLAGFYPGVILSNLPVIQALKSDQGGQRKNILRESLAVIQFVLPVILIILTLVASAQLKLIQNMNLGFKREQVLVMDAMQPGTNGFRKFSDIQKNYDILRNELLKNTSILKVSGAVHSFMGGGFWRFRISQTEESVTFSYKEADYDFVDLFGVKLIAGRDFSREIAADALTPERGVALLTRNGARKLGVAEPSDAIGKILIWSRPAENQGEKTVFTQTELKIVGVVEDINTSAGYRDSKMDIIINSPEVNILLVKIDINNIDKTLSYIDSVWRNIIPEYPLNRYFYDSAFAKVHHNFNRIISGFAIFSILAISIACLGLYAMASFIAERRRKEVGVRKVLGASVADIIKILLWDLSKPVAIAIAIAIPISILIINRLLQRFPEQVPMHMGYFLAATGITLAIAWLTVVIHTWRVANLNPAVSLRYE